MGRQRWEAREFKASLRYMRLSLKQNQTEKGQTSHVPHTLYSKEALGRVSSGTLLCPLLLGKITKLLTTNLAALWGSWHCQKECFSQCGHHYSKPCQEASATGRPGLLCPASTGLGLPTVTVTTTLGKLQNRDGLTLHLRSSVSCLHARPLKVLVPTRASVPGLPRYVG